MNRALGVGGCFLPLRFRLKPFTSLWGPIKRSRVWTEAVADDPRAR